MTLKRFLIILLVVLIPPFLIWLYLPGWTHYNELKREDEHLKRQLRELEVNNQRMREQEYLLKNDVRYLEKVLREELNVIRPDELVYKLVPEDEKESQTAQA